MLDTEDARKHWDMETRQNALIFDGKSSFFLDNRKGETCKYRHEQLRNENHRVVWNTEIKKYKNVVQYQPLHPRINYVLKIYIDHAKSWAMGVNTERITESQQKGHASRLALQPLTRAAVSFSTHACVRQREEVTLQV